MPYSVDTSDRGPWMSLVGSRSSDNARYRRQSPSLPGDIGGHGPATHHVKGMATLSKHCVRFLLVSLFQAVQKEIPTQSTVIPREFARWTSAVELDATDPTDVVVGHVPAPGCDGIPFLDSDFHLRKDQEQQSWCWTVIPTLQSHTLVSFLAWTSRST